MLRLTTPLQQREGQYREVDQKRLHDYFLDVLNTALFVVYSIVTLIPSNLQGNWDVPETGAVDFLSLPCPTPVLSLILILKLQSTLSSPPYGDRNKATIVSKESTCIRCWHFTNQRWLKMAPPFINILTFQVTLVAEKDDRRNAELANLLSECGWGGAA